MSNSRAVKNYDDLISGLLRRTLDQENLDSGLSAVELKWINDFAPALANWRNSSSVQSVMALSQRLDRLPDTISTLHAAWEVVPAMTLSSDDPSTQQKAYLGIEVADDPALHFDEMEGLHTDAMTMRIFALLRRDTVRNLISISPSLSYNPTCLILLAAGRDVEECLAQLAAVFVYDAGFVDTDRIADWFHIIWRSLQRRPEDEALVERFVFENMLTLSEGIPNPSVRGHHRQHVTHR